MVFMRQPHHIAFISAEDTHPVRFKVLWPHKSGPEKCIIDNDYDAGARHIGAFNADRELTGVCSLFDQRSEHNPQALPLNDRVYRLRVMGTIPEVRGEGSGAQIIEFASQWCQAQGVKWLWCDAREVAFGFYQKMHFEFFSEAYEVPEIGMHRMMARKL